MMKKRPFCAAALFVVLLLLALPARIWMKDAGGIPEDAVLQGEICRMEPSAYGQTLWLTHTNLSDTGIILVYFNAETPYSIGNTIRITGTYELQEPEKPTNPGQFDARLYYQTEGAALLCYAEEAVLVDGRIRALPQLLHEIKTYLGERCIRLFGEKNGGVLQAMILGSKAELDTRVKDLYRKSGMSHLLAISGLHISIFGMGCYKGLRRLGLSYALAGVPSMLLILLYGEMTGMSTSTTRAVIMFLLAVGADLLGRSYDLLTALSAAALLLLAEQPLYVRSASFLLSFGAVLGIGLLYPALHSLFPCRKKYSQAFLVSLSVQLITLPLIQYFYFEIPVYSVILNLLVIPLMTALMFCGTLAVLVSCISFPAARLPAVPAAVILLLYEKLGEGSLRLPSAVWVTGRPAVWQLAVYYAGTAVFLLWRYRETEKLRKLRIQCAYREERGEGG